MPRILIVIPAWNEARIIARSVVSVRDAAKRYLPDDIVMIEVSDNASTDGTGEIAASAGASVFHLAERGKGIAIRCSWERHFEDADILVFTDADLAADLSVLPALIAPLRSHVADIVCGSRFIAGAIHERRPSREIASHVYRLLQRALLHLPVHDAQCGLKAISIGAARQILPLCRERQWLFDTEFLALATMKEMKIFEIPVQWVEHRDPGRRSALHLFRDGWGFLLGLVKIKIRLLAQ